MAKDLQGKTIVLGITGGIAAYKMPNVAHALAKRGADVHVLMTRNATEFIAPLVFETLTNRRCIVDTFDRNFQYDVAHVSLANAADLMLIAPATANVIAKLAHGLADDMLTTVTLAATCPKLVAPAMNTHMLENPITRDNIDTLARYGFTVIPSGAGLLACGDVGSGRLPEEQTLLDYVDRALFAPKDLAGKKVVVTAGATQEPMDPVRYITNHSTGKMGYAVARACMLRGADVTLLLARTQDILGWVGAHKPDGLFVCGFSMETENLLENSTAKLHRKNLDMVVANNLKTPGAGFGVDTNVVTLITRDGAEELPLLTKDEVAMRIAAAIAAR